MNALEDHAAVSCAIQNLMLYLAARGIGSKWMTGKMGIKGTDILKKICNVKDITKEHYMGTILIGEPEVDMITMPVPKRKQGTAEPIFQLLD